MSPAKADIIAKLRREILPLQGISIPEKNNPLNTCLGSIRFAFPQASFPTGAIHEFICEKTEDKSASGGFISAIAAQLMKSGGATVWISNARTIFPPALKLFGIEPDKIIFIDLKKAKDILWVMEESLKCNGIAAVVGETETLSFKSSRRLQLAVESSKVTGFIIRNHPRKTDNNACVSRWKICQLPSQSHDGLPGIGLPNWNVELLKIRNGKPGSWQLEWNGEYFKQLETNHHSFAREEKRKTG